jgi:hypothetical protein
MYANMALLMFYPYQKLNKLTTDGSNWKKIINNCNITFYKKKTKFWKKGFKILQNIEDRSTLQKHVKRARGPILMTTINKKQTKLTKTTSGTQI